MLCRRHFKVGVFIFIKSLGASYQLQFQFLPCCLALFLASSHPSISSLLLCFFSLKKCNYTDFCLIALLNYNSYSIKFTHFKFIIQQNLVYLELCNHHRNQLQNIFNTSQRNRYPLAPIPIFPTCPLFQVIINLPSASTDLTILIFDINGTYNMQVFVIDLFYLGFPFPCLPSSLFSPPSLPITTGIYSIVHF